MYFNFVCADHWLLILSFKSTVFIYLPAKKSAAAAAAKSLQLCLTLCDPMDCSHQAPPFMGFSRQEYWSGVPLPSLAKKSKYLQKFGFFV